MDNSTSRAVAQSLLPDTRGLIAAVGVLLALVAMELAMGRPPICTCGYVKLWHGVVQSSGNSQHIADWYSFSHVIHGLLFYFFAWLLWRKWRLFGGRPSRWALAIAVAFEAFWELLENSPMIIDRYRAVTVSYGYSGDSIVNSASDVIFMMAGFWLAARLPVRLSIALAILFELFTLLMIRDNLTLNILMLVWPVDAIRQWQAGA
ncbi:DUF2585 domain-containing protein [Novosphingobium sp. ZN18A2]|uniref:DUF2585 domain-containing protein n=1 Tax=Novosphingobium sp. ZN18A2 TaxID=3079861 RepID=UPI0030CE81D7